MLLDEIMRLFEVLRRWARNPQPRMEELRPFTRAEMDALADELGPLFGPLVVFAAETGLRTNEWVALERRDVDRDGRAVTVQRRCADGALTPYPKSTRSRRRVPLTAPALGALDSLPPQLSTMLLLPSTTGGYLDLHNWRYANGTRLSTRQGSSGAARTTCGTRSRPRPWRPVSRSSSWPG